MQGKEKLDSLETMQLIQLRCCLPRSNQVFIHIGLYPNASFDCDTKGDKKEKGKNTSTWFFNPHALSLYYNLLNDAH